MLLLVALIGGLLLRGVGGSIGVEGVVVVVPALGLANRLRIVVSALILAEDLEKPLFVAAWNSTMGLPKFNGSYPALRRVLSGETLEGVVLASTRGIRFDDDDDDDDDPGLKRYESVVVAPRGQFASRRLSCREYFDRKRRVYRRLRTPVSLARGVWIGLHVRTFDPKYDWAVVAPQDGSGIATTWDRVAPVPLHFEAASQVLAANPTARLFVASNSLEVKHAALDIFGSRASILNKSSNRERPDDALLDFFLLADCALILHTFGSSFGEEAAAVNSVPSVRIRANGHLLGVDVSRPHCNNPLFKIADDSPSETASCYQEPTKTQVCSSPLRKSRCDSFAWGLADVYC